MATFILLGVGTVGSGGSSGIDFTSLPATYTDFQILISARTNRSSDSDYMEITFNNNTSNYTGQFMYGNGSSTTGSAYSGPTYAEINRANADTSTASVFGNVSVYISSYASSNYKSLGFTGVSEQNGTTAYQWSGAMRWSDTSAINRITISPGAGTSFSQYSSFYLYGISNA